MDIIAKRMALDNCSRFFKIFMWFQAFKRDKK